MTIIYTSGYFIKFQGKCFCKLSSNPIIPTTTHFMLRRLWKMFSLSRYGHLFQFIAKTLELIPQPTTPACHPKPHRTENYQRWLFYGDLDISCNFWNFLKSESKPHLHHMGWMAGKHDISMQIWIFHSVSRKTLLKLPLHHYWSASMTFLFILENFIQFLTKHFFGTWPWISMGATEHDIFL